MKEEDAEPERELEALLKLSQRSRQKLGKLREVLTAEGHYGRGATPYQVVHRENKLRLLRLVDESGQPFSGPPVFLVPAPVSRYFIMDLKPKRSFAAFIAESGFDVYIADFGIPTSEDRFGDLKYYVDGLVRRCVTAIARKTEQKKVKIVGYCLGGTLSLLYTALYPDTVEKLVLLTTTVDGDVEGGIPWVAHRMGLEGESFDDPRLVPAAEVKSWFEMLAPGSNSVVGRVADLWQRLDSPVERLLDVRTMASWVDDVVPASGRLLADMYRQFGPTRNGLMNGTAQIGDKKIDTRRITMPLLSVSAEQDSIAPPEGVDAIAKIVPQAEVLRLPGGHVGIVAGRAATEMWKRAVVFLKT